MKLLSGAKSFALARAAMMFFLMGSIGFAQEKIGTIQATAHGQGNQAGMNVGVTLTFQSYSTAEDRKLLWEAFEKSGSEGLVNAIIAMPVRGHLSFAGVADYEIAFIRALPGANGRKLRVVAKRPLPFGQTQRYKNVDYLLSAVELDLSAEGGKGAGTFIPACDLSVNQDKEIEIVTYQSPWRLDQIVTKAQ